MAIDIINNRETKPEDSTGKTKVEVAFEDRKEGITVDTSEWEETFGHTEGQEENRSKNDVGDEEDNIRKKEKQQEDTPYSDQKGQTLKYLVRRQNEKDIPTVDDRKVEMDENSTRKVL